MRWCLGFTNETQTPHAARAGRASPVARGAEHVRLLAGRVDQWVGDEHRCQRPQAGVGEAAPDRVAQSLRARAKTLEGCRLSQRCLRTE